MPGPGVAVNVVPKHCEALIPDGRLTCQIGSSHLYDKLSLKETHPKPIVLIANLERL